jgi:hypothetical protein
MKKTVSLSGWTYPTPLYLSFSWRAYSGYYYSTVTNMALYIYDGSTYLYGYTLISGGAYDTGWRSWGPTNIASYVAGHSSITIYFQLVDAWAYNWNQQIWADNVRLSYTPTTASLTITSSNPAQGRAMASGQVYLIYLSGSADGGTRGAVVTRLQANNIPYTEITTWASYNSLISNPPNSAVVIFLTGEMIPWDPSAFPSWSTLFQTIGTNARDKGWFVMMEGGYTAYYAVQPSGSYTTLGGNGYNTIMSVVPGASVNQGYSVTASITGEGQNALNLVAGSAGGSYTETRTSVWSGVTLLYGYYASGGYYAASAVRFGQGALYTMGWGLGNPQRGDIIVGAVMYAESRNTWGYLIGATVKISAVPISGYTFDSWIGSGSGSYSGSSNPATITMNAAITETAYFVQKFTVTFYTNPSSGGSISVSGIGTYTNGQSASLQAGSYTITASPPVAYRFFSWSSSGSLSLSGGQTATMTVSGSGSVTANFQPDTVAITFQLNGISLDATGTIITIDGIGYTYSQFPRSFTWSVGSTHTLAAADPVAAGTGKQYDWTSWTNGDGSSGPSGTYTTPGSSQTVTANYVTQYQLTVSSAYDSPNPMSGWFNAGTSITASVSSPVSGPSGTRCVCTGWTGTGSVPASGAGTSVTFTMSAPSSITWNWKMQYQLTMQVDPSGSGSTNPAVGSYWYDAGSWVPISATAASGYVFQSWVGSGTGSYSGTNPSASITMNDPTTETAKFVLQVTMTVSYSVLGGGAPTAPVFNHVQGGVSKQYTLTTTATPISVDSGSMWSVTPNPLSSSGPLERWYSSQTLSGTASTTTIVFTFYHQYLQTLSYSVSGDGSGYSAPTFTANRNGASAPQVLSTPAIGYWYDAGASWTVTNPLDGSGASERWYTSETTSGTVSAAQTVVFNYRHQFKLTIQVNDPSMGTTSPVPGEYWYDFGTTQPVTATATSGNQLSHWELDGSSGGSANPYTVTINMAHTLTAVFEKQEVDHFIISEISSPQTVGVAFTITITTVDAAGQTVAGYTGPNTLSDTTGTITPTTTGAFTNGVWTGQVTINKEQAGVTITTTGNGKTGISNSFDVFSVYQVTITATGIGSDALGIVFTVDGVTYLNSQVPIMLSWEAGSSHTVEAAQSVTSSVSGKCYNWDRWVGGGSARVLQITANSSLTLTASFRTQYLLSAYSVPPGAQITRAPTSADGFYDPGTTVQVTAAGNNGGAAFTMWLLNGVPQPKGQATLTVTMTQPFVALAMYESQQQQQGIGISAYDPIVTPLASILIIAAALVVRKWHRE